MEDQELSNEVEQILTHLPKAKHWNGAELCKYQGFWNQSKFLPGMIRFQRHFNAQDNDILLITFPKLGTLWLKALTFTIVNRYQYTQENSLLLTKSPHELIRFLDLDIYLRDQTPTFDDFPQPRIFSTHTPYASLPSSIMNSNCRIVYMCRNPLDQFISQWKFWVNGFPIEGKEPLSLDEAFEMVCEGIQSFGPVWEHVLGYWKASKEQPNKILFLKYEDLKEDTNFYVKRLASFLGYPLNEDEEKRGVIKEISKFCSFGNMKNLEVKNIKNDIFYRKGEVGDWKYYLTPSMSERLEKIIEEKLSGSGLTFKKSHKIYM